ncbi:MAG TPA: decarboxylating 6-phosphogluconate dehydrogenase [Gemmatimonadaceae bacterium]
MQLAMIGLGKMGGNMSERLLRDGHKVVVYDRDVSTVARYQAAGAAAAKDLADVVRQLSAPRVVWIMVPAGAPTDETIEALASAMSAGDVIIDGGNSNFKETVARGERLAQQGLALIDCGTSGGVWGLENGYCLMVGGEENAVRRCEPIFRSLTQEGGYAYVGTSGAGHYVKMVHNGIEYALMQGYGEGYEILASSKRYPNLDLAAIAELWQHGSVVRSWLNELAVNAFQKDPRLSKLKGYVSDSGEGRWTVQEAIDLDVPAPTITLSLLARLRSRQEDSFGAKVLAALRNEFGGHAVKGS